MQRDLGHNDQPILHPGVAVRTGGAALVPRSAGTDTTGGVFQRLFHTAAQRILEHEPGVREGDAHSIHQMRAGVRRLRALLKTFQPVLDPSWLAFHQGELKWLAANLGAVRDRDVLLERLEQVMRQDDRLLAIAREHLQREREAGILELLRSLESPRAAAIRRWLVAPEILSQETALAPARAALPRLLARQWKRLKRRMRAMPRHGPIDTTHHEARKQAKVVRYAAEALTEALPKRPARRARRMARRMADLQTALGALQDHRMACDWLAHDLDDPVLHMLLACEFHDVQTREDRECEAALRELRKAWRKVRQRKVRRWIEAAR